jgi:hypothetical protein
MYQLSVSANGLAESQSTSLQIPDLNLDDIQYVNGLIYASGGSVYDPVNGALQHFPLQNTNYASATRSANSFIVDTSLSRAYAVTNDTVYESATGQTIEGFNLTTLQPTWIARFPSIKSRIVRWGTNGLAFFDGNPLSPSIVLISGTVVAR